MPMSFFMVKLIDLFIANETQSQLLIKIVVQNSE